MKMIAVKKDTQEIFEVSSITFCEALWNGLGYLVIKIDGKDRSVPNEEYEVYGRLEREPKYD